MFLYNGFAFNVLVHEVFFKWKINLKFRFGATPSHGPRNRGGTGARCPLTFVKIKKMCPFFIKNGPLGNFDTAVIYTCSHVKYIIIRAQTIQN